MDRRTLLAFILIGLILVLYPLYVDLITGGKKRTLPERKDRVEYDTTSAVIDTFPGEETAEREVAFPFVEDTSLEEKKVLVETDLYEAEFTTRGGNLVSFILKKYKYSDDSNIQLVPKNRFEALNIEFPDAGIDFSNLVFQVEKENVFVNEINLKDSLVFIHKTFDGVLFKKSFIFYHNKYHIDLEFESSGLDMGRHYLLSWKPGLQVTEKNFREDLSHFKAYAKMGDEIAKIDKFRQPKGSSVGILDESRSGKTRWIVTRSKYFLVSIVPTSKFATGFVAKGEREREVEDDVTLESKRIGVALKMPIEQRDYLKDSFMVYIGPLDYHILKEYKLGLENIVDLGWKIIRPFSIFVLWIFSNLFKILGNYGLVIIFFTLGMKVLFHPLTRKSVRATQKMQEIQPLLTQLKERYKKDPQRLNKEMMKLYKEQGVNPFGGCLPLIFQMPLFYSLFVVCRSTIELRGAKFIFWLKDLSQMDPYYVLPIVMAVTMFLQQKMTIKDPKQMALVYFMPILFFFMFKSFPAGLTLYWTFFNIFSLVEQYYIKWKTKPQPAPV